jgi:two-component system response regulator
MNGKFTVLLVDDNENDRLLFGSALKESGLDIDLFEVTDGYAAINYLLSAEHANFPLPEIVFLDLTMQGMDGFAVLKEIRARPELKGLAVIVLTSSILLSDKLAAHALGANAVYQKPSRYHDLVTLLQTVIVPWLHIYSQSLKRKSKDL